GNELIFMPSVAGIVRNEKEDILFQYKGNEKKWSLPAGAIEIGEPPAKAVVREVWEETGLIVIPKQLSGVFGGNDFRYEYPNGHKVEYNVYVFDCEIQSGSINPIDSETTELRYFSYEDMPKLTIQYPKYLFQQKESKEVYFQWNEQWTGNMF
ncbi:MAG TPA: NUDIX domain-containing protein, partial [Virgibacillus sp.]|nr:NUDIX domain-containing protein [Virgibacillus sp.]